MLLLLFLLVLVFVFVLVFVLELVSVTVLVRKERTTSPFAMRKALVTSKKTLKHTQLASPLARAKDHVGSQNITKTVQGRMAMMEEASDKPRMLKTRCDSMLRGAATAIA